jgi:hypothetical protein
MALDFGVLKHDGINHTDTFMNFNIGADGNIGSKHGSRVYLCRRVNKTMPKNLVFVEVVWS